MSGGYCIWYTYVALIVFTRNQNRIDRTGFEAATDIGTFILKKNYEPEHYNYYTKHN